MTQPMKYVALKVKDIAEGNVEALSKCGVQPLEPEEVLQLAEDMKAEEARKAAYAKVKYKDDRRASYPAIGDQLDAIWKWLSAQPNLPPELADMLTQIQNVKSAFPKPQ